MKSRKQIFSDKFFWAQVAFWIGYYLYYAILEGRFYGYGPAFQSTAVSTSFAVIIFYGNALYLFPEFFKRNRYVRYFLYGMLFLSAMVAARLYGEYLVLSDIPMFGNEPYNGFKILNRYVMGIITMAVSVPLRYMYDYFRLQAKQQQIKNRQLETEMKYLKLQVNPHFLFNTLNNLLYLTRKKSDEAPGIVEKLADLMRYLIEKEEEDSVALEEEIRFIESYLELERIRIPTVNINFEKSGPIDSVNIPPMLFIPLVENAFKHGIDKSSDDNFVKITLEIAENSLHLRVENPGREDKPSQTGKKGLKNLRKRLELLYPKNHTLVAEIDDNHTFIADLTIPV